MELKPDLEIKNSPFPESEKKSHGNNTCIFVPKGINREKNPIYEISEKALIKLNREQLLGQPERGSSSSSQMLAFCPYKLLLSTLLNDCTITEAIKRLDGNFHLDFKVAFILGAMIAPYGLESDVFSTSNTQHLSSLMEQANEKYKPIYANARMKIWDEKKISESIGSYLESLFFLYHRPHANTSYDGKVGHAVEEHRVAWCKSRLMKIKPPVYLDVLQEHKECIAKLFDGAAISRLLFGKPRDIFVFSHLIMQLYLLIFAYCYYPIPPSRYSYIFEKKPDLEKLIRDLIRQILSAKDISTYEPYLNKSFKLVDHTRDYFVRYKIQTMSEATPYCRQMANDIKGAFV